MGNLSRDLSPKPCHRAGLFVSSRPAQLHKLPYPVTGSGGDGCLIHNPPSCGFLRFWSPSQMAEKPRPLAVGVVYSKDGTPRIEKDFGTGALSASWSAGLISARVFTRSSDQAVVSVNNTTLQAYTGVSAPDDQWAQVTIRTPVSTTDEL